MDFMTFFQLTVSAFVLLVVGLLVSAKISDWWKRRDVRQRVEGAKPCPARAAIHYPDTLVAVRGVVACAEPVRGAATDLPGAIAITKAKYTYPSGKVSEVHETRTARFAVDDGNGRVWIEVSGKWDERGGDDWRIHWRKTAARRGVRLQRGDALSEALFGGNAPESPLRGRVAEWVLREGQAVKVFGRVAIDGPDAKLVAPSKDEPLVILVESD